MVIFTAALFLSGYAIQQRTLRDLREAIKPSPRPKPQIFLPDRFKTTTTELEDGTIVVVDLDLGEDKYRPPKSHTEQIVIEVRPTAEGDEEEKQGGNEMQRMDDVTEGPQTKDDAELADADAPGTAEATGDGATRSPAKAKKEKKISRAERRRLIKEEIQRLAQAERPMLYQRRLW